MKHVFAAAALSLLAAMPVRADGLETYARFDRATPPGNLAIAPNGRMFMSVHVFFGPDLRVVEVMRDGSTKPYPNLAWASAPQGDGPGLKGVFGLRADKNGILWILDGQGKEQTGRVIAWNTTTEQLHRIYYLGQPAARPTSSLNDLAVDLDHNAIYIADPGDGQKSALIVLDLETGRARRVLEGTKFTLPEDVDMVVEGRLIATPKGPARIGINPITVDPTNSWVYFAPMSATSMYRIRTTDLLDETLSAADLEARVERYGDKPVSDGTTIDADGNVYITDIGHDAIGVIEPDGSYEILHQSSDLLSWPNGFAVGADGYIYLTVSELQRSPFMTGGEDKTQGKFKIVRFRAVGEAVIGR